MTRHEKWQILRALPILDDETWEALVAVLDRLVIK